ncbi:hypothetical protein FNV43_RR23552 [Rhamnella rubrinervis]|uniref:Gamma-tubulin complex component n=1 Tax=Rhamnella rubrinervis TaxID=2594499 RepID=A0A8K0DSI1_9ROSA|nr:hypothetical protein FNV43_RR23552 [Rhamnella rubrinervis]
MAETKRKSRDEAKGKKSKKSKMIGGNRKRRGGVGLPSKMRKELDRLNPSADNSDVDEDIDSAVDVYEYEEGLAQEDSKRNRRFDAVENLEYKLPDEFEDENVSSDYDSEDSNDRDADANGDEDEGFDDGRHESMLQEITEMPSGTGKKKKKNSNVVISEPYPESEYNPSRDVLDGDAQINIEDLLDPLHGKSGYSKLRKRMRQMERKSAPIHAPLSKAEQGRLERKAASEQSKKDLVKWEPLVKRNREAPTIYFDNKKDLGFSTVGAIASEFEPRTEFEKKIASLVYDDKVMDAHKKDGSRLLELNKVSVEDEKDRQNHIAKMRSLLFRHEMKAKRIKKIKSKTYHRLLKKDRLKAASAENHMDPEAAKDLARKHEYERAKERMTLRHKSSSKWAKRIKERGFDVQDEGTRAAVAEQQHLHALLTRKRNSMRDSSSSSSEDSSDEDDIDENFAGTDQGRASRLLQEAKEKTLKVLNADDEMPNSGVLSLPFMVRGMKKRDEAAAEEAKLALQDLEALSKQFEGSSDAEDPKLVPSSGRMVFSGGGQPAPKSSNRTESDGKIKGDRFYDESDSEDHLEAEENDDPGNSKSNDLQKDVNVDPILLNEDSDIHQSSLFKSFDEIVQDTGPKTTCEVAIFASGTWKKMKSGNNGDATNKKSHVSVQPVLQNQDLPETMNEREEDSDSDSEGGEMVDGILSSGPKPSYELPSQGELIRQAFAADDVEDDFEKDKMEILKEENPEPEKPVLLPGWGQWTNVQQKKGLPSWMLKEHENAKKKREEALKKRKDGSLRNVIISEKLDKKAEKLYTKALPFPFTSKEVFEQSIRMPIGPEFNPATAVGALNRPEVVKTPGVIIKPIEYEDVDPYGKEDHSKQSARKQKKIKGRRMLHELLLALLGYTGDLIIDVREQHNSLGTGLPPGAPISDDPTFKLAPDISFLQPSEKDLIERIVTLGFYYRELDRFATRSRNLNWIRSANVCTSATPFVLANGKIEKQSVYRRAIANGIVEILSVYRSAVLHIEQKLLSETVPILAAVTQGLNKFFVLLPPLYELVLEIERGDVRGGQLLNLLHKRCHCGVPELQTCIQRLLWHGHQVMYNQLAAWMVYGILQDQYGEFFIGRQEDRDSEHGSSQPDLSEKLARLSTDDTSLTDWHLGFHIVLDMLPEYIHMRVAESILFAGKAIRVLRNPSHAFWFQDAAHHQQIPKGNQKFQFTERFSFQNEPSADKELTGEELIPQSEADKIEAMLSDLKESSEFHKRSFEYAVDSIRAIAASHLWQLVVVRADLNGHLKALKDYFLLAKGDFFQCFLEESRQLMRLPPRQSTAEADLMVPFQLAAIKSIGEEDKYFSRVSLRMPSFGISVKSSQGELAKDGNAGPNSEIIFDGWDGIALEYTVDWPLQLFFTQEVLSKYCRVFQYLLRLKRTQMELEKSWASVMHQDHRDFAKRRNDRINCSVSQQQRQRFRPMWRIREHMAFLIRNLQFYIQVDVIESQWNVLQAHIQDSHDFTELVGFHQEYLSALISQSFLDIGSLSRILDSIMKLCLQFCWNIENQESSTNTSELEHIIEEFNKKSNSLYTILRSSRLVGSQRAPFLRRFLMRLNFNSFFEVIRYSKVDSPGT